MITLKGALARAGSKKEIAARCGVSPAQVSKAFGAEAAGTKHYKIRVLSEDRWVMKSKEEEWRPVRGRAR